MAGCVSLNQGGTSGALSGVDEVTLPYRSVTRVCKKRSSNPVHPVRRVRTGAKRVFLISSIILNNKP